MIPATGAKISGVRYRGKNTKDMCLWHFFTLLVVGKKRGSPWDRRGSKASPDIHLSCRCKK